ncbi:Fur family transcriptional regulator [Amycolatopsis sp. DSM 110486]|uniref:Fur family transcriptional regulator n=1 Tax=Amycolatopsis sp. DSM 110486 TaxID=2865832 RepID=UPI001C699365|nr:Fur family transcriptional regulator [Amycolatopsis sp. DSM 110486]QYN18092.1 transcriptional repressor [Amycolatopsis sp. DSM 110486]
MDDFAVQLKRRGLRNTAQRRAVLGAVRDHPHTTAAEIAATVEAGTGGLSRQGLYNVLDDLVGVGLLRTLEPAGSPARFELDRHDNHHHLVCRGCGRIEDVPCAEGSAPCLHPSSAPGFTIDEAEVTWWGLCAECAARA